MKLGDVERRLSRLQESIASCRDTQRSGLEDLYWAEVSRLRDLGHYERLPEYVSWLVSYRNAAAKYLRRDYRDVRK